MRPAPLQELLDNNRHWAEGVRAADPGFFQRLVHQQSPHYLWIGCSDSRVPANTIVGLVPGDVFVHRNVANQVVHSDLNGQSVIQYAVEVLRVHHVIVCGHYGCGGVRAALDPTPHGLIDHWLHHLKDLYNAHREELDPLPEAARADRLCELNVRAQVRHVAQSGFVQDAWRRGHRVSVHGWIYGIEDGLIHDLGVTLDRIDGLAPVYRQAVPATGPA